MKVVYVINALGEGGTERSLADLLPGLRDAGIEPHIITLQSRGDEGVERGLRSAGFPIDVIGPRDPLRTLRTMRKLIRSNEPAVVHSMLFAANLYSRLACVGLDTKVLISLVNTTYSNERLADPRLNPTKVRLVQALDVLLARLLTAHFHAVSESVKRDAEAALRLPSSKITVIERGRRPETLPEPDPARRAVARASLGINDETDVLVAVGRHEYQKGHRYLLEAMRRIGSRRPLLLLIAGRDGNESSALRSFLDQHPDVAARVRLLGHRSDVADVLAASDLFVFPSLFEGMPGAMIEAMATGLAAVASDIPPVREVCEPGITADLVPPRDPDALAAAIEALLDDPDRRTRMGNEGRRLFEERFTMSRSITAFIELYEHLSGMLRGS